MADSSNLPGAANFIERALASAISWPGFQSGASLATVACILDELLLMLMAIATMHRSQRWTKAKVSIS